MKLNRTNIFIAVSSIALLTVLLIQVNWIVQSAKIKEEIFNEKANMVVSKTADALSTDTLACRQMEACIGKDEIHKTDSLFTSYMKLYDFHTDYSFQVKQPNSVTNVNESSLKNNIYKKRLDEVVTKNGLELNLFLPGKKQFILAEMGTMFITSVILILVVLVMFWRTIRLLMREKKLSEHTTDFLNNMTHEFKTPLTNIALAGNMMIRDTANRQEDKIKHYSGIILEENEKLRLQVEQVLSMTALERGEIPLQKIELNFHEIVNNALKCLSIQIENKKGKTSSVLNAEKFIIMGDRTHLTNAICNLIDNSLKYSKTFPHLTISTNNFSTDLIIQISDKGIGIEKEYQKKVFDKYFRVPTGDVHDVKGFGLGLAYIKKIVELHGGTIALQSEPGEGTTFTIKIPDAK
jgi:two-component system, OmpR family, phosphate regulon sensor histidine kinase PhoR